MTDLLYATVVLIALVAAIAAPVMLAMQLTSVRPQWSPWLVTGLSALPTGLPFLAFAAWIAATSDITPCAEPPCGNMAPLWFQAMLFLGVLALLLGFGLAWLGRLAVRKQSVEEQDRP